MGSPQPTGVAVQQQLSVSYSGPVPPPAILKQYNDLVPGSASQILEQARSQTEHRIALEKTVISSNIRRSNWGLVAGFVVAMTAICLGSFLVYLGHDAAGATIAGLATAGLVSAFIYGTTTQRQERKDRINQLSPKATEGSSP